MIVRTENFSQAGFTLLELLISMAIFSILGGLLYSSLGNISNLEVAMRDRDWQGNHIQLTKRLLELDLLQAVPRPIRNSSSALENALIVNSNQLQLTRAINSKNRLGLKSPYTRIRYQLKDENIIRSSWIALDRINSEPDDEKVILQSVEQFLVSCADRKNNWHEVWPQDSKNPNLIPRACIFTIKVEGQPPLVKMVEMGY